MGRCPGCGEWNTLVEEQAVAAGGRRVGREDARSRERPQGRGAARKPVPLAEVEPLASSQRAARRAATSSTGCSAAASCPGSIVLIGGSPGIGKSTLMSAALGSVQAAGGRALYVSGEESAAQIRLRAERLGADALDGARAGGDLARDRARLDRGRAARGMRDRLGPDASLRGLTGAPGSVGQVREVAARLERFARERGTRHDPRRPRHQGRHARRARACSSTRSTACCSSRASASAATARCARSRTVSARRTRSASSRCAPAASTEVADPSERFLREAEPVAGSCLLCSMEGSRPLLVEVQALVAPSDVVPPRRVANGIDRNRLSLILAVLARNGGPSLGSADVFVNVAGGVRIEEPGADLAIALAVASAATRRAAVSGGARARRLLRRDRPHRRAALCRPSRAAPRGGGALRPRARRCCPRAA